MKRLKYTFTIFSIIFISISLNAQVERKNKDSKKINSKIVKKEEQDKTCISGNCQNGKGVKIYYYSRYKVSYDGYFKNGKYSGQGVLERYKDGDGFVVIGYQLNNKYNGRFVYGNKSGYGEETNYDGKTIYKGNWKFNKKNGNGKLYTLKGKLLKSGNWKNGIFVK